MSNVNVYIMWAYRRFHKYFVTDNETDIRGISQLFFSLYVFSYHLISL